MEILRYSRDAWGQTVLEGMRTITDHGVWMEKTHHREGDKALLVYDDSKAPERSNPMDACSEFTGNTCFS